MKAFYHWPKMLDTISAATRTCLLCARVLTNAGDLAWKQRPTPPALPRQPFTDIALDVHGPYFGNLYVLTCTCRLTTYLLCKPLSTAPLTSDVIEFLNSLTCTYGTIPERIRSDNGSIFCRAAHQLPTVDWEFTPTYASVSNGGHERKHRDLARFIRLGFLQSTPPITSRPAHRTWTHIVQLATMHVNLMMSPSAHGLCPRDLIYNFPAHDLVSFTQYHTVDDKDSIWRQHRQRAQQRSTSHIPMSEILVPLQTGMSVLVREHQPRKDQPRWSEPIQIQEVLGDNRVLLTDGRHVHTKNIKPLIDDTYADFQPTDDDDNDLLNDTATESS
ncbi:hypothetical protein FOZ62_006695 [Perkinsus olseni]|uniref:Integrase catalytic domain-containing protein n=1 Tax=Perkinsus olseni TaxID=32597 RepID=A0A7J6T105_PEROL|nr:hypothetical protein FOZ62_006695 [Perkinsus olseni]